MCSILTCSIAIIITRSFKIKWASVTLKSWFIAALHGPRVGSEQPYRCVWHFKVLCYWRRRVREQRPLSLSSIWIDLDKDDKWGKRKDCVSLHQQNVSNVLWKVRFQYTAFECELYFLAPFAVVNLTFEPCGWCAVTFPLQEKSGHRSWSIFLSLPVISISQPKERKKNPLGTKEGLNPLPAVCLSISHTINPHGVISLGGAPLMRCSERGGERGRGKNEGWEEACR